MNCIICLEPFETYYAFVPELNCECIFITHEDCWSKWTGDCLYCRRIGIPELRRQQLAPERIVMIWICMIYLVGSIVYFFGKVSYYIK